MEYPSSSYPLPPAVEEEEPQPAAPKASRRRSSAARNTAASRRRKSASDVPPVSAFSNLQIANDAQTSAANPAGPPPPPPPPPPSEPEFAPPPNPIAEPAPSRRRTSSSAGSTLEEVQRRLESLEKQFDDLVQFVRDQQQAINVMLPSNLSHLTQEIVDTPTGTRLGIPARQVATNFYDPESEDLYDEDSDDDDFDGNTAPLPLPPMFNPQNAVPLYGHHDYDWSR